MAKQPIMNHIFKRAIPPRYTLMIFVGVGFIATILLTGTSVISMPDVVRIPIVKPHGKGDPPDAALFSHRRHSQYYCYECHPTVFPQERYGFTHKEMKEGAYCATCHNGKVAWAIDDDNIECESCHREK